MGFRCAFGFDLSKEESFKFQSRLIQPSFLNDSKLRKLTKSFYHKNDHKRGLLSPEGIECLTIDPCC